MTIQHDTRQLLRTGISIFATGVIAAALMLTVFGGVNMHGPHTNSGWLALIVALGCVPTGILTLALACAKLIGDRKK